METKNGIIRVAVLGSTGSIGTQTLDVIRKSGGKLKAVALSAHSNAQLLKKQIEEFKPLIATLETPLAEFGGENDALKPTRLICGNGSFKNAVLDDCDVVMVALSGIDGLEAVLKAIEYGKDVALCCKEAIVAGGEIIMEKAKERGVKIYPVDSEHSALWQCLNFDTDKHFEELIITASGGALRDKTSDELENVTVEQVLKHPTWKMGKKITVDCATMMNKGFEVIEAMRLFNAPYEKVKVVLHRESIIHSMVRFSDGAVMAELSSPDMELPISLALYGGKRVDNKVKPLDFYKLGSLTFGAVDEEKYPCFALAMKAAKLGGLYPSALNGADEQAVKLFLDGKIRFKDVYNCVKYAMDKAENGEVTLKNIREADQKAAERVVEYALKNCAAGV